MSTISKTFEDNFNSQYHFILIYRPLGYWLLSIRSDLLLQKRFRRINRLDSRIYGTYNSSCKLIAQYKHLIIYTSILSLSYVVYLKCTARIVAVFSTFWLTFMRKYWKTKEIYTARSLDILSTGISNQSHAWDDYLYTQNLFWRLANSLRLVEVNHVGM